MVDRRSGEIRQQQDRTAWLGSHSVRSRSRDPFDLNG